MKFAKLEIKMILALILSRYEYKLVDTSGKPPKQLPQPNRNDIHQVCICLFIIIFKH
jgi:cytochrome P450